MYSSLSKETKTCQVCKKTFPSASALRVHMRSHAHKLSASNAESSSTGSTISLLRTCNKLDLNFSPDDETVLVRSVHMISEVSVGPKQDLKREEGGQQITRKRKMVEDLYKVSSTESNQWCSTFEYECALTLLELSKPKNHHNQSLVPTRKRKEIYIEIDSDSEDVKFLTSNEDIGGDEIYLVPREKKCNKKYMCDICGIVLHSHQALGGGHRTSHTNKRLKICDKNDHQAVKPESTETMVRRCYECHICGKVFNSGQALGGHMKVHYVFLQPSN